MINARVSFNSVNTVAFALCSIRKNGTIDNYGSNYYSGGSTNQASVATVLLYMNGTTDYVELYCVQASGGNAGINTSTGVTFMSGCLVRAA